MIWAWRTYVRLKVWRWWLIRRGADPAALLRPERPPLRLPLVQRCGSCTRWSALIGPDGWCRRCERAALDIAADRDQARRFR